MDLLGFEAARKRADERLNQELVRIRNLPKRSKIKICNKHGLKYAHHMNTGLLKSLEIDLNVIQREQRRVVNELNKKRNLFTTTTQRYFPCLLPCIGQGVANAGKLAPNHHSPRRFHASWSQAEFTDFKNKQELLHGEKKKERLLAMTKKSKEKTRNLIENNIKKLRREFSQRPKIKTEQFVTRLNRREMDVRRSCFPSLLQRRNEDDE